MSLALILFGLAAFILLPVSGEASSVKVQTGGHAGQHRPFHHGPRVFPGRDDHRQFSGDHRQFNGRDHDHRRFQGHGQGHHRHFNNGAVFVFPAPVYVVEPRRCWQPGYYAYQWVPQQQAYNAWVPGHWAPDGSWMDGRYETRWYTSGYYQPYWVEGYWNAC